ncbi:MAG: hypothetical protein WKF75_04965 [Singulisphaera sp.]
MSTFIEMKGTRALCICCGEVWTIAEVMANEGARFIRHGATLAACPTCGGTRPKTLTPGRLRMLEDFGGLAAACGADIEAFGWFLEVFKRV